ncbi:hypothetical protein [Streptomyces sp. NPDC047000]|uniref:effector-associated constant component EACC1 n=1 Tax=Streptomyces sp. NPDC047000 TaxID=3155474 RepID=UPI0033DA642E
MRIALRLVNADADGLETLEDWLKAERGLRRVVIAREHVATGAGEMGVLTDCLHFTMDAGLISVLAQSLVDYWRSRGDSGPVEDRPALRVERADAPDGTKTVTIEARDLETAEALLRKLRDTLE